MQSVPHKTCTKCGVEKPISAYGKRDGRTTLRAQCKECYYSALHPRTKEIWHAINQRRDESNYFYRIFRKYGLSREEYSAILQAQGGVCAICQQTETTTYTGIGSTGRIRRLSIDHDHVTGQVRGLLCNKCNPAIGFLADNPERMERAMEYLEKAVKERQIVQLEMFR